jgi:hypothetical protein
VTHTSHSGGDTSLTDESYLEKLRHQSAEVFRLSSELSATSSGRRFRATNQMASENGRRHLGSAHCAKDRPASETYIACAFSMPAVVDSFVPQIPAEAETVGGFVVLALTEVRCASEVESEHFVIQVQTRGDRGKALSQINAALRVHLKVRI